ncbi:MAG: glycine zipper 2TM domain-containing protein [Sulfuritalea sp.]|jgi:outer membrane lipoprotein SlyB|nr:glycine zipper 2TM domain-containing protein [Sulfuritalea sp.]
MNKKIILGWFALAAFFPLAFSASQAQAQAQYSAASAAARIDGFDVEPVAKPAAGNELAFTLYGSPGGTAAVQIGGATGGVVLVETEAGVYEGTYTIRKRDKITARSTATANLRVGNRVASAILDEPLIGRASPRRPAPQAISAAGPKIDRFDVDAPARLVAGEELMLTLSGSPGGTASARIAGVKGKIVLDEVRAGVYEGSYTIKNRDRIADNAAVTANLRIDKRETSAVLGHSLVAASRTQSSPRPAARLCVNCGVVEAINVIEVKGQGSYLGPIAGGVAGALLGSQVGHGSGTTIATVVGAAGGAYAGSAIEKSVKTTKHYEVVVRLENGGSQTISYAAQPGFAVGTKVKVANGALTVVQ